MLNNFQFIFAKKKCPLFKDFMKFSSIIKFLNLRDSIFFFCSTYRTLQGLHFWVSLLFKIHDKLKLVAIIT